MFGSGSGFHFTLCAAVGLNHTATVPRSLDGGVNSLHLRRPTTGTSSGL